MRKQKKMGGFKMGKESWVPRKKRIMGEQKAKERHENYLDNTEGRVRRNTAHHRDEPITRRREQIRGGDSKRKDQQRKIIAKTRAEPRKEDQH